MSQPQTPTVVFPSMGEVIVENRPIPTLGPRQVRVQAEVSLISAGTELSHLVGPPWIHTDGRAMPHFPFTPGYSHAGRVVEVGEEVAGIAVGERLGTAAKHQGLATLGQHDFCAKAPSDAVSSEALSFATLSATVLNAVRLGEPQFGEVVVVLGLGLLGQMAARVLKVAGMAEVIGIDLDPFRLGMALDHGAITRGINPSEEDPVAAVDALSGGRGADVVYEVTGRTASFDLCFELARKFGRVVAMGSPRQPASVKMMDLHMKAIRLIGAIVSAHPDSDHGANRWTRAANAELFLRWVAEGKISVDELVTHRFPAARAADAYRLLVDKTEPVMVAVLDWTDGES